ncbi:golgin subfamily A member 3-like, partial [Limulus polyphemus]|uniref:Golgin subfamily A member 3-like n=1 Tax=Limulus polyphemus TaxID=6850 RepID=A0ABM1RX63_LIMPO
MEKRNHVNNNRQSLLSFRPDPKILTPGSSPTPPEDQEVRIGEHAITNEEGESMSSKEIDDEENLLYNYECQISSLSYPNASDPATQYFNKSNPELCAKTMESFPVDVSSSSPSVKQDTNSKEFKEPLFSTPFGAMTNTCEALALQQSVIGDYCVKPVSAEIVAKIVASTKERLNNAFSNSSSPNSGPITVEVSSKMAADNIKNGKEVSMKGKNQRKVPGGVIFNELIRYPSETIKTIFEKKSGLFNSSSSSVGENPSSSSLSSTPKKNLTKGDNTSFSRSRNNSQSSIGSIDSRIIEMAGTHIGKKHVSEEVFDKLEKERMDSSESTVFFVEQPCTETDRKKLDSVISDKVDIDYLYAESVETESNLSGITGIEDEMFCIKKLLIDVPSSHSRFPVGPYSTESSFPIRKIPIEQQTVAVETQPPELQDQATETDSLEYFGILCENATLQGQVDTLRNEIDCVMKEKVQLQGLIASLESRIKLELEDKKVGNKEKQEILTEFEKISREHRGWSNVIAEYQSVIDSKVAEIKGLKEDLSESELERTKVKVNLEETKVDLESKDGAIDGLKKKIAELHVEVLTLLQGKVQLENEVKGVKGEMETLRKSKEWYQQQLNSVQENRNTTHQELIKVQAEVVSSNNLLEHKKVENRHLKQQLIETQQKAVREKEILMKHLENIEMDMVERESLFQEIQKDRGAAEESLTERMKKLEEEQSNMNNLNFTVNELEHQLAVAKHNLSSKDEIIHKFEKDQAELVQQVVFYQKTISEKDLSYQWLEQQLRDSKQKLTHTELELSTREEQIMMLKEEKTAIEIALAAANEEKRTVNETLLGLKENLNRVEGTFRQMRTEFVAKSALVEQLQKEKNHAEDVLQKTEEKYLQQKQEFELKFTSEAQNVAVILQDVQSQKNELETVLEATKKELLMDQKYYSVLIQEKDEFQRQLEEMTKSLRSSEEKVKSLSEQNSQLTVLLTDLREKQGELNNLSQAAEEKYQMTGTTTDDVSGRLEETYKLKLHQLEETLETREDEFRKKQKMYESNIKVLTRKLKESMKAKKKAEQDLQKARLDEEKDVSQIHTIDAGQQTHEDGVNKRQEITEHVVHEQLIAEKNIDDYRKKQVDLEEELTIIKKKSDEWKLCANKRQELILELEKEKGQLRESLATIKQHMTGMEAQLMEKQTGLSELSHQMKLLEEHQKEEAVNFQKKLASLEQELNKEKTITKELRRQ